ncbi:uncharacterized protein F4822DRAFT_56348 [Hypoxylon trugodes]|uniref:uncharacterized protein n=1 Tax=Hypoxylon trugodes TaxID=326681 RepID=UPI00219F3230|nr:uncharacterized protein F4822DRAFT_56348 [Hypoxylon trugodes]KAI1383951.1 hypothetical protein F4822DRAFT_56348 [Hypoxylon trugodes]
MKFLSGVTVVGMLAAGLPSVQGLTRRVNAPFTVSKLSAGATPHSSVGYIELTWSYGGLNQTKCSAQPGTYQVFPTVAKTVCSDPSTSFNLTKRSDGGADLELWHEVAPGTSASAVHTIQASEIVWTNQQSPTGTVQVYAGPQNFTVNAIFPKN